MAKLPGYMKAALIGRDGGRLNYEVSLSPHYRWYPSYWLLWLKALSRVRIHIGRSVKP